MPERETSRGGSNKRETMEKKLFNTVKEYGVFFLAIFLISALIRIYFACCCGIHIGGDGHSYSSLGEMIYTAGLFNPDWLFAFDTFRPPVYPFFIAVVYTLFGKSLSAVALSLPSFRSQMAANSARSHSATLG